MKVPIAGRRVAKAEPRQIDKGVVSAVALLILAVVAITLTASGKVIEEPAKEAVGVLVDHAVHGCPYLPPETQAELVTIAAPVEDLGSGGDITYGAPGDNSASAKRLRLERGELLELPPVPEGKSALAIEANGPIAAGLSSFAIDESSDGLTVAGCASPASRWWFTGAGATIEHSSELILSNLDPGPAVVDVRVLGPEGEIETLGTRGVSVPPNSRTTIKLADVAPQGEELAVSVVASRGRVVAAMSDSFAPEFGADAGVEWIPAQASARRAVSLAGLPTKADSHTLIVANPSELEALVDVKVAGEAGSFTPSQNAQIRVGPGAVVSTDITEGIAGDASAVTLRSKVPVTASIRSLARGDSSYAGSVLPLTGPAVAPVVGNATNTALLSAGDEPATASITAYDKDGTEVDSTTVRLDPGATSTWAPKRGAAYLVVTPKKGKVFGAVSITGRSGVSQVPLVSLALRLERPAVRPALS